MARRKKTLFLGVLALFIGLNINLNQQNRAWEIVGFRDSNSAQLQKIELV
jgi:hypothetical protein